MTKTQQLVAQMTHEQQVDFWNGIADDTANRERIDNDLRAMRQRQLVVGHAVAIIEVHTPWKVVETADV